MLGRGCIWVDSASPDGSILPRLEAIDRGVSPILRELVPYNWRALRLDRLRAAKGPDEVASLSQLEDQVADGGGLGEEGVVAGVELHDAVRPTGEPALGLGGGALVLCADEVRRRHILPGR